MTTGHKSGVQPPTQAMRRAVTRPMIAEIDELIRQARYDGHHDVPLLGNRSRDARIVYGDRHLPTHLGAMSIGMALKHHEIPEWYLMHRLHWDYDRAHRVATFMFERPFVEHALGHGGWERYQEMMGAEIAASDRRSKSNVPPDLDVHSVVTHGHDGSATVELTR